MRNHGVRNFPDPQRGGQVPKGDAQQFGVSTLHYQAAQRACQHLIPNTGDTAEQQQEVQCAQTGDCPQAVVQQWMSGLRDLARCLRTHGEPNWPDPIITSLGGHPPAPHFPYEQAGIDHHSNKVWNEVQECVQITGFQGLPLPWAALPVPIRLIASKYDRRPRNPSKSSFSHAWAPAQNFHVTLP
jgi:hypothetical protein